MQIIKVVGAGIVGGFFLFLVPFLMVHVMFFFVLGGLLFRLFVGRRYRRQMYFHHFHAPNSHYHPYGAKEGLEDHSQQNPQRI